MEYVVNHDVVAAALVDEKVVARFWGMVDRGHPLDCWNWRGELTAFGYGRFCVASSSQPKTRVRAHRFAYALKSGALPTLLVLHSCDNRACCNPRHLRVGTHQDNTDDAELRGRLPKGSRCKKAKLTESLVRDARARVERGEPPASVASDMGVHVKTIRDACKRLTWRHVDPDYADPALRGRGWQQ